MSRGIKILMLGVLGLSIVGCGFAHYNKTKSLVVEREDRLRGTSVSKFLGCAGEPFRSVRHDSSIELQYAATQVIPGQGSYWCVLSVHAEDDVITNVNTKFGDNGLNLVNGEFMCGYILDRCLGDGTLAFESPAPVVFVRQEGDLAATKVAGNQAFLSGMAQLQAMSVQTAQTLQAAKTKSPSPASTSSVIVPTPQVFTPTLNRPDAGVQSGSLGQATSGQQHASSPSPVIAKAPQAGGSSGQDSTVRARNECIAETDAGPHFSKGAKALLNTCDEPLDVNFCYFRYPGHAIWSCEQDGGGLVTVGVGSTMVLSGSSEGGTVHFAACPRKGGAYTSAKKGWKQSTTMPECQ